jgi:hypothetical protein
MLWRFAPSVFFRAGKRARAKSNCVSALRAIGIFRARKRARAKNNYVVALRAIGIFQSGKESESEK